MKLSDVIACVLRGSILSVEHEPGSVSTHVGYSAECPRVFRVMLLGNKLVERTWSKSGNTDTTVAVAPGHWVSLQNERDRLFLKHSTGGVHSDYLMLADARSVNSSAGQETSALAFRIGGLQVRLVRASAQSACRTRYGMAPATVAAFTAN